MEREQAIRELAYAIWESNGRPDGCAEAHWHQAEARIDADAARTKEVLNFFTWAHTQQADELAKGLDYVPLPASTVDAIKASWHANIAAAAVP